MELMFGLIVLAAIAVVIVLVALRTNQSHDKPDTSAGAEPYSRAQRDFYRQRRKELQTDLDAGLLDQSQFFELCRELDYQMVSEGGPPRASAEVSRRGNALIWAAMIAVPLVAVAVYWQMGYHRELGLKEIQQAMIDSGEFDRSQMSNMVERVESILEHRPDNAELLVMMAGIRRQQGDYAGAIPYYERLKELFPKDPNVVAQLAQARYLANGRRLNDRIRELLDQALETDPNQGTALGVYGIDAFARGDHLAALGYWTRLLRQLPPQSAEAGVIASGVAEAKSRAIAAGTLSGVEVTVSIDNALGQPSGGVLFVVAKSADGNPMPVAALRQPLADADFPQTLWLTDLDVIRQGQMLGDFSSLILSAHISRAGTAVRQAGDWTSSTQSVDPQAAASEPVTLKIDRLHRADN